MSTSDLYVLNGKSTTHIAEFRNGWGSAPVCWDYLGDKYITERPAYSMERIHLEKVWALVSDNRLEDYEKVPLMMTFDRAYISLKDLSAAGDYCERFGQETAEFSLGRVNHWRVIGHTLKKASSLNFNRHARGVVLSATSVSDCWSDPSKDWLEDAWDIFDEMRNIEAHAA